MSETLQEQIRAEIIDFLRDPTQYPEELKGWLPKYLEVYPPNLSISQVFGFSQFTAQIATSESEQSVTSTTFATFTSAPSIGSLPNGNYVVLFGAAAEGDDAATGSIVHLAASVNGATPTVYAESTLQGSYASVARGVLGSLSSGANTVALVGLTTIAGHTSKLRDAWLMTLKTSDL